MRTILLTLTLGLALCACNKAEEPAPPKSPAPAPAAKAPAGPEVGRPCAVRKDCSGNKLATVCGKDGDLSGFPFCTSDCAVGFKDRPQCGDGGACVYVGQGKGRCVPSTKAATLAKAMPPIEEVVNPCCLPKEVNAKGIGARCASAKDCGAFAAKTCPQALRPGLPNWCTHLCEFGDDASCGEGAFCWWRPSKDRGMVGSCAPLACKKSANPPACPPAPPPNAKDALK